VVTLKVSGTVDDFLDTSGLQGKIANVAGVDKPYVSISVAGGSVIITAIIKVPASTTTTRVFNFLSTRIGTAAKATSVLNIPVEEDPIIKIEGSDKDDDMTVIWVIVGVVVGTILLIGYFTLVRCCWIAWRKPQPTFRELEVDLPRTDSTGPRNLVRAKKETARLYV